MFELPDPEVACANPSWEELSESQRETYAARFESGIRRGQAQWRDAVARRVRVGIARERDALREKRERRGERLSATLRERVSQ